MNPPPERRWYLFVLVSGPLVWAVHFIASYSVAAVWCARYAGRDGSLAPAQSAIGVMALVACALLLLLGRGGLRRHRFGAGTPPHDDDTPEDRHRFLGLATLLLASLSAVAVIYQTLPILFLETCR